MTSNATMNDMTKNGAAPRRKASTAEILGTFTCSPKINSRWQKHYNQLIAARDDMAQRKGGLVEIAKEEQQHFSLHMGDAGTDQYDQDFALSMLSADQNSLYEIEEALNRIQNGSYGICELSGQPIEAERLEAIPWTRFSAAAQRELEETGSVNRTTFGKRRSLMESEAAAEEDDDDAE